MSATNVSTSFQNRLFQREIEREIHEMRDSAQQAVDALLPYGPLNNAAIPLRYFLGCFFNHYIKLAAKSKGTLPFETDVRPESSPVTGHVLPYGKMKATVAYGDEITFPTLFASARYVPGFGTPHALEMPAFIKLLGDDWMRYMAVLGIENNEASTRPIADYLSLVAFLNALIECCTEASFDGGYTHGRAVIRDLRFCVTLFGPPTKGKRRCRLSLCFDYTMFCAFTHFYQDEYWECKARQQA